MRAHQLQQLEQLQQLQDEEVQVVSLGERRRRARPVRSWLIERNALPGLWPLAMVLAWMSVMMFSAAVQPAPTRPEPTPVLAEAVLMVMLAATAVGVSTRRRAGLVASAAAAGLALFGVVMCPVSGHHETVGAWWFLQLAAFTGLVGLSVAGLRAARTSA